MATPSFEHRTDLRFRGPFPMQPAVYVPRTIARLLIAAVAEVADSEQRDRADGQDWTQPSSHSEIVRGEMIGLAKALAVMLGITVPTAADPGGWPEFQTVLQRAAELAQ